MTLSTKLRRAVKDRDGGICLRCLRRSTNIHHRVGGTPRIETLPALVSLCGSGTTECHGFITEHPTYSYESGWAIRRSDPRPPSTISLTDLYGHTFHLTDDGLIVPAPIAEGIPA
jgi:hypothetical protein